MYQRGRAVDEPWDVRLFQGCSSMEPGYADVPAWIANPVLISADVGGDGCDEGGEGEERLAVEHSGLDERIKRVLIEQEMATLFPVQEAVLRHTRTPCDFCVSAPTGSGKTLAYVLPIVQGLAARRAVRLRALVVVPGRELASQVAQVFAPLAKALGLALGLCVGQASFGDEQRQIVSDLSAPVAGGASRVDILIATPGRLLHHLELTRNFTLQHVQWLVLDEADRLLDEPSRHWLHALDASLDGGRAAAPAASPCGATSARQQKDAAYSSSSWTTPLCKLLFSATLTRNPAKLADLSLRNPVYIAVSAGPIQAYTVPRGLQELLCVAASDQGKPLYVMHLLDVENITRSICFTKSVDSTERWRAGAAVLILRLARLLQTATSKRIAAFSGKVSAEQRAATLRDFNAGLVDLLVCSDAAARGLDLAQVACVVNYDAPRFMKTYVHRVGRTARAGNAGLAYTILAMREAYHFKEMVAASRAVKMPVLKLPKPALQLLSARMAAALAQLSGDADGGGPQEGAPPPDARSEAIRALARARATSLFLIE